MEGGGGGGAFRLLLRLLDNAGTFALLLAVVPAFAGMLLLPPLFAAFRSAAIDALTSLCNDARSFVRACPAGELPTGEVFITVPAD